MPFTAGITSLLNEKSGDITPMTVRLAAVQRQRLSDDRLIAAEASPPESIGQDHRRRSSPADRRRPRRRARQLTCAPSIENSDEDTLTPSMRSGRPAPVRLKLAPIAAATRSNVVFSCFDVEILPEREPVLRDVESGRALPEDRDAIGVRVRKRPQEQRVGDAEDARVFAPMPIASDSTAAAVKPRDLARARRLWRMSVIVIPGSS